MEEEENYSLQTEPTWEHKALSGTDSTLCDEDHNICGFSLLVVGWKVLSGQIAAEPLMSSPWAKCVWLTVKNKSDFSKFNSFTQVSPLVDTPPLGKGASHRIDIAPSTKNWISSGKGLMLPNRFCLKGIIFFYRFSFLLQVCEQLLKGIVYPLAVKSTQVLDLTHQKRARCSGVVRSSFLPLQARFHYLSL